MGTISLEHLHRNGDREAGAVGDPATILCYSDSHAATIIKRTPCTITVQRDKAIVVDKSRWPDLVYEYERDLDGPTKTFHWSGRHGWQQGSAGNRLLVGVRREYRDPTF